MSKSKTVRIFVIRNFRIKKLHQVGLIQKWLRDYLPKRDRCWKNNRHVIEVNNHTVNMDDMQGSFFVLFLGNFRKFESMFKFFILGFLLSFFITIGEKLWFKYISKKKRKIIEPFTT